MASFTYIAKNPSGEEITGEIMAASMDEVVLKLHTLGLAVLHVSERRGKGGGTRSLRGFKTWLTTTQIGKTSSKDLALFSRQLATVLESGIPLAKGLRGLAADSGNKVLGKAVGDICTRIESGETLSDALGAHPQIFPKMYLSMVRAGERSGTLAVIVDHLAIYLEKTDAIKGKVKSALSYPIFVLSFAVIAALFLLLKIVPTFASLYADLGSDLPGLTQFLIDSSELVQNNFLVVMALVIALAVTLVMASRTEKGRYALDSIKLNVPIFGVIIRKSVMSRFTRTFGILLKSGLPILEGLDLVGKASGNAVVARAVDEVKDQMEAGQGFTESFRATGKFPEMVLQLMATGEESGGLDSMLQKTSDFYDREVEAAVHSISTLIEPLMLVIVGSILGVMVLGMFMPIFSLGEAVMSGGYGM